MCQKLVDRVAQSKQLMAVADPETLGPVRGLAG